MRKTLLIPAVLLWTTVVCAQTVRTEIREDVRRSAGCYMAYPGPGKQALTPAPEGKKPFYISHYGRYGSRYHAKMRNYDQPWLVLGRADSLGLLTPLGREALRRIALIRQEAVDRWGELTPLGAEQHRQIARRMVECFPEVFADTAFVDAKGSIFSRCILSMEHALLQLISMNPRLRVTQDATFHDAYYLNQNDTHLKAQRTDSVAQRVLDEYMRKRSVDMRLMKRLFTDMEYVRRQVDVADLSDLIFKLAGNQQNTRLRDSVSLYDLYDEQEPYYYWQRENAWWYVNYGACPLTGGRQPFAQRKLVRQMIEEADQCIQAGSHGVHLRFGHDDAVLQLVCLLNLNGYGLSTDNLESLQRKGWAVYRLIPMAANVQLVFYRSSVADRDVVFKVLLNENEVRLPLNGKTAPYYRWADFKDYFLKKLDAYEEQ